MAAGQPSSSATSRLTMSSHGTLVARTTLRTCSSSAATANRVKGNRTQEYLMARLVEMGIAT